MLRSTFCIGLVALALSTGVAGAAEQGVQWETTVQAKMTKPMAMTMPSHTSTVCGPAEPLKQAPPMNNSDCKLEDFKRTGNRTSYKVVCTMAQGSMVGDGWAEQIDDDHYKGHMTITGNAGGMDMAMAMDYHGKKVGTCEYDKTE